ncbi:dihydropteroate synthase [Nocardioides sp. NPDC004968]|uniref:dihydropteroate synthase n=1 Tax=Nocardioides sp. NPDC004968 TaxID=3155894 RepID=UPI00339E02E2
MSATQLLTEADRRCQVMGIINVTPDSFSDGGRFLDVDAAVRQGLDLMREGADLLDVGGESTRPGAQRVSAAVEIARVIPVVEALAREGLPVSVDTMRASVAQRAVEAGAVIVNDVSGGLADPRMLPFLAEAEVTCVLMHWRAHSMRMDDFCFYDSVVGDVCAELRGRVDSALDAGVRPERIILDPGLGFAKNSAQSWELLSSLSTLRDLGFPLLVGASRKRFLTEVATYGRRDPDVPTDRDEASDAVAAIAAAEGAWGVRVHSVSGAAAASRVAARLRGSAVAADVVGARAGRR